MVNKLTFNLLIFAPNCCFQKAQVMYVMHSYALPRIHE